MAGRMKGLVALTVLLPLLSCGSTVPGLTTEQAQTLIETAAQTKSASAWTGQFAPLMKRSLINYTLSTATSGPALTLKQLLSEGLVSQSIEVLRYPDVAGTWVGRRDHGDGRGFNTRTLRLQWASESNALTGDCRVVNHRNGSADSLIDFDEVRGTVSPSGSLDLSGSVYCFHKGQAHLLLKEEGTMAHLDADDIPTEGLTGQTTGARVERTWYEYALNTDSVKLLANGTAVIGAYEVRELSDLRLVSENSAVATFTWHVSLNKIGQIMMGAADLNGVRTADFVRNHDGTWALLKVTPAL